MSALPEEHLVDRVPSATALAWFCAAGALFLGVAWCHTFVAWIERLLDSETFFWEVHWPQVGAASGAALQLIAGALLALLLFHKPRLAPVGLALIAIGAVTSVTLAWFVLSADFDSLYHFPTRPAQPDLVAEAGIASVGPAFLAVAACCACVRHWSTYRAAEGRLTKLAEGESGVRSMAAVAVALQTTPLAAWTAYALTHNAWSSSPSLRFDVGHLLRPIGVLLLALGVIVLTVSLLRRPRWIGAGALASAAGAASVTTSVLLLRAASWNHSDTIADLGDFFGRASIGASLPIFATAASAWLWWRAR